MQALAVRRNWLGMFLAGLAIVCATTFVVWAITWPAIKELRTGQPLSGGWTWVTLGLFDLAAIIGGAYLIWIPLAELLATYTEQGMRKPTLLGPLTIHWVDVTLLEADSLSVVVTTRHRRVRINRLLIGRSEDLAAQITQHVPPDAVRLPRA